MPVAAEYSRALEGQRPKPGLLRSWPSPFGGVCKGRDQQAVRHAEGPVWIGPADVRHLPPCRLGAPAVVVVNGIFRIESAQAIARSDRFVASSLVRTR